MSSSDSDQYEDLSNLKNGKFQVESEDEDDFDDEDDNGLDGQNPEGYDDNDLDDDEDEEKSGQKITAWGSEKKRFYQEGDEEASDDEAEEEEARLIEKLQNEKLDQSHFFDVFGEATGEQQEQDFADEDKEEDITGDSLRARLRSLENLADSEKLAFLKKESPELLNIIKELKTNLKEVKHRFLPLVSYFKNRKGENREGQKYIELKFNLLMSYCMSLSFYILLNIQGKSVKDHPVIKKLISVRTMLGRLKPLDKKLQPEINQLLKDLQNNKSAEKAAPVVQKPVVVQKSIKQTKEKANAKTKQNMFEEPKVQAKPVVAKKAEKKAPKELLAKRSRDELIKSNKKKVEEDFDDEISDSGDENADLYGGFGEDDDKDEGGLDEEDEFYRKIKQVKQNKRDNIAKEKQDKNAAKFEPNPNHFLEEEDVRGINKKIMKNKGLTRKRGKKHEGNSRVKFSKRYEKAQYAHRSQGKFVREKQDVYSGETRAIKSGMIRSTKIGRQ